MSRPVIDRPVFAPDYPFMPALACCIEQAASGKGEERHGQGKAFVLQPWVSLGFKHGAGFLTGQAEKKWLEAQTTQRGVNHEWWIREVTGALVYTLLALIHFANSNVRIGKCSELEKRRAAKAWLVGAWPVYDLRREVPIQERDFVVGATKDDRVVKALQCQALDYAEALCARLKTAGIVPPRVEFPDVRERHHA